MRTVYREETYIDKSQWPDRGPWDAEPDKVQWTDPATGLACLAVRGRRAVWCGYVGVTKGHPFYRKTIDQIMDSGHEPDVHGGINYAAPCDEGGHICHVPEPGQTRHVWWLGFDCGHGMDYEPCTTEELLQFYDHLHRLLDTVSKAPQGARRVRASTKPDGWKPGWKKYRDLAYVKREVRRLARQLKTLEAR